MAIYDQLIKHNESESFLKYILINEEKFIILQ